MLEGEALSRRRRPVKTTKTVEDGDLFSSEIWKKNPTTTPVKRRKKRKHQRTTTPDNDPPFYVLFLQTGTVLSLLFLASWRVYRYIVPAPPPQPAQEDYDDDYMAGLAKDLKEEEEAAAAVAKHGSSETQAKDPLLHQEDLDTPVQIATEYVPPPLPLFNLSQHANYDAFALAKLFAKNTPAQNQKNKHRDESGELKRFWKTASNLRRDFAELYGGENAARTILDRGLSTFGWDHHDTKDDSAPGSNFPSDLKHTACRIYSARNANRTFRFTFGGYSVTVGRGNYFHQSFPFVLERKLHDAFELLGVRLNVTNAAVGGCPSFPYGWCMKNFWGEETDVISWDFAMNEAGGDPFGLEAYIRHALQLPRRPKLIVKDTHMATQRRDLLKYYLQTRDLKDSVVLHTEPATEPFLSREDRDLPLGFRDWRKVSWCDLICMKSCLHIKDSSSRVFCLFAIHPCCL